MTPMKSLRFLIVSLFLLLLLLAGCQKDDSIPTPAVPTPHLATGSSSAPAPGFQRLLVMPDDGPDPVLDLIDSAQTSIRFKIYLFTYREARDALIRAAQRGVDVQVLIDREPVGGGESNAETYERLKQGGVQVKWAPGAFKHHHEKSMVVDDHIALISTFNFTFSSFTQNREYAILTTEPQVVADVAAIFDADWQARGVELSPDSPLVLSPNNSRERITALIQGARHTLWLEEATLLDDEITQALIQAARRGVDVRFIAPQREDRDDAEDNLQKLEQAGGHVVRLDSPYVHAKAILADDQRAFIGSVNLSYTSFELNRELGIITDDEDVIARLRETMARDWKAGGGQEARDESAPTPTGPASPQVIDWQDAAQYVGQDVIVEGEIVHTYDSGKVTFLNFDEDYRHTLTLVIFPDLYDAFPQPPARYFKDKRIRVQGTVDMYKGAPEIIIQDPRQIQVVGESPRAGVAQMEAVASEDVPVISWQDAAKYVGQHVIVEGQVVRTYNSGKAAFLNFDENWRDTLSVVIFASDFPNFPEPPDQRYLHQVIRVSGRVKMYRGAPEIIVSSPDQIEIVGDEKSLAQTTSSEPPRQVVPWQEAARYVGQTITVQGKIVRTRDIGTLTFLNFSKKRGDFVAIVRAEDYHRFPAPPAELYRGKRVWMTGQVTTYQGTPQMVIHSPDQVEVFD